MTCLGQAFSYRLERSVGFEAHLWMKFFVCRSLYAPFHKSASHLGMLSFRTADDSHEDQMVEKNGRTEARRR